jgi:hypothetical protein
VDTSELVDLVEASDFDGLVRFIDGVCAARDWSGLVETRDRCFAAETRGKQLFGVVRFAEYRLALEAPGEMAASVLRDGAGRFALGPLWEVAASTHEWAELGPYLESPRMRALVGAERALRGEDLEDAGLDQEVLGLPFSMQEWEPRYPLAVYRSDRADFPSPESPTLQNAELPSPPGRLEDLDSEEALYALVRPWAEESNGITDVTSAEGPALGAVALLTDAPVTAHEVSFTEALAHMAWAGASGGAHGSRRGSSVGRSLAWAVVATLADLESVDPAGVGDAGQALHWMLWHPAGAASGWGLHLAVEDPRAGYAWAIRAVDKRDDFFNSDKGAELGSPRIT